MWPSESEMDDNSSMANSTDFHKATIRCKFVFLCERKIGQKWCAIIIIRMATVPYRVHDYVAIAIHGMSIITRLRRLPLVDATRIHPSIHIPYAQRTHNAHTRTRIVRGEEASKLLLYTIYV